MSSAGSAKKAVRSILGPVLALHGFERNDDRSFLRRRADLLDGIGIQFGRGAESFYLHVFVKPLADPIGRTVSGYRIGNRFQSSSVDGNDWTVSAENDVDSIFRSIASLAVSVALPYLDSIEGLRDYVVEAASDVNYRARLHNFDLAVALAGLGKVNKVVQICEETMKLMSTENPLEKDERERIYSLSAQLRAAATQGRIVALLDGWRDSELHPGIT